MRPKPLRLLLLILPLLLGTSTRAEIPDFPFVFARGNAEVKLPPDMVNLTFAVQVFNEDPSAGLSTVQTTSSELLSVFKEHGIGEDAIVSHEIDKHAVRRELEVGELEILGYELRRFFRISIYDLESYTPIMSELHSMTFVVDIDADFDRLDRDAVETKLISQATADARRKAQLMAAGAGARLGPVHAISQTGFGGLEGEFGVDSERYNVYGSRGRGSVLFVPSTVVFSADVSIIYRLNID